MWKYILIGVAIIITIGVFVYVRSRKFNVNAGVTVPADTSGSFLTGTDKADYTILSPLLVAYMNCAADGGDSQRCPPNWRDGGATKDKISSQTIAKYNEQLATTQYTNDDIRKVAARNLLYMWQTIEKKKISGRLVSAETYKALREDVLSGSL